jgi:hypothetical protein
LPAGAACSYDRPMTPRRVGWFVALVALATCSGIDNVTVAVQGQAVIPRGGVLEQLLGDLAFVGFDDVEISQSQEIQREGYDEDDIDSVRMLELVLTIAAPAGGDFDFLDSVAFFVEAEGQPRVEIARRAPVPTGLGRLELEVDSSVELRPYAVAPSMIVSSEVVGRRPEADTTVEAAIRFDVDIDVSGAACGVAR